MTPQYSWVPILIIAAVIQAWVSHLSNLGSVSARWWVFFSSLATTFIWLWITCVSKSLVFDAILFDVIIAVVFAAVLMYLQSHSISFTLVNYIGAVLAVIGLICLKLKV